MEEQDEQRVSELCRSARERVEPCVRSVDEMRAHFAQAADEAGEALRLAEALWGANDDRLVPILSLLAECSREVRHGIRDERPLPYLFRAIAIAESSPHRDLIQLGHLYSHTGIALSAAEEYESARDMLSKSVAVFERLGRPRDLSFALGALGSTTTKLNPAEALPICKWWVDLEASEGPGSWSHYAALTQLARCYLLVRNGEGAIDAFEEAKGVWLKRTNGQPNRWLHELEEGIQAAHSIIDGKAK